MTIGLLFIGTGPYLDFFPDFYRGAEAFFFPQYEKAYYIISDFYQPVAVALPSRNVTKVKVKQCLWPWPTLNRFNYTVQLAERDAFEGITHLFFFNANCRFVALIDDVRLLDADLIATLHPGFFNKPRLGFTYESRKKSTAYIAPNEGKAYYAGGFQGGRVPKFVEAYMHCLGLLMRDLSRDIIAVWHDESYWNRYLVDFESREGSKFLAVGRDYLFPLGWSIDLTPKIILLDKRHIRDSEGKTLDELKKIKVT